MPGGSAPRGQHAIPFRYNWLERNPRGGLHLLALRAAMHGVAGWLAEQGRGREVIVAHDTRFLGERMAELAARILRQHGVPAVLPRGLEPTPVVTRAIPRRRAAGAGVLDRALEGLGLPVRVLRGESDPGFGGSPPDPAPQHLQELTREVRRLHGPRLGLATDGDADRHGAVDADVAGEESGGFALARFGHDKDGMLASCLLFEIVAASRKPLRARLGELARRHGSFVCGRRAVPGDERAREALAKWLAAPPTQVDGKVVREASRADGLYLSLDDGFLMLRASGTEPLLRVYDEARGAQRLRRRLAAGEALRGASGVSSGSG